METHVLEGMVQAYPVSDFMSHVNTIVKTVKSSNRKIIIVIDDAIEIGIGSIFIGESRITGILEVRVSAIGVDVQGLSASDAVLVFDRSVDLVTNSSAVNYGIGLRNSPN